jgi:hypothetical protein
MKRLLLSLVVVFGVTLNSTEAEPTLVVAMPELATYYAVIEEPVEGTNGPVYQVKIYSSDGGIVSEFQDCAHDPSSGKENNIFDCTKGNEELNYSDVGFFLLAWTRPGQMEIFESDTPAGKFNQLTSYTLNLYQTAQGTFTVNITFDGDIHETYSTCEARRKNKPDCYAEIYCMNDDGTDVLIHAIKKEEKLVATVLWTTPNLPDNQTFFQGEMSLLGLDIIEQNAFISARVRD